MLIFGLVFACSTRVSQKEKEPFEDYELGPYDQTWQRKMQVNLTDVYSKSPKSQLRYAKHAAAEGDYDIAIAVFTRLLKTEEEDSGVRAEALYLLGKIYSNILYPYKDYQKAIYLLEKFIAEYPDSEFRLKAEQSLENIQKLMKM